MIGVDRNVDFRYAAGHPGTFKALVDGTRLVRCVSLPEMEAEAEAYLSAGIRVIAVYTGESDAAGRYVMHACSALQIGNEPEFAMQGAASWPTGSADDMVNVWSHVATVLVPEVHPEGLPLIGPGIWAQDYARWAEVADRLPQLGAAAVHCYPDPSGQSPSSLRLQLSRYRAVKPDVPLICTEWHSDSRWLEYARAIDQYCEARLWFGPGVTGFELEGTDAYGILALARSW